MGCDFDLYFQAKYSDVWVTIFTTHTKTFCLGYPLTNITRDIYRNHGVHGDYCADELMIHDMKLGLALILGLTTKEVIEEVLDCKKNIRELKKPERKYLKKENELMNIEDERFTPKKRPLKESKPKGKNVKEEVGKEEEDGEDEEAKEFHEKYQSKFLFYSKDQFGLFVDMLSKFNSTDRNKIELYYNIMKPVPNWLEMAKTALPFLLKYEEYTSPFWMSDDNLNHFQLTKILTFHQLEMFTMYQCMIRSAMSGILLHRFYLPIPLLDIIAEYAKPIASDIRLAWYDDEGQCKELRDTNTPNDIQEPKCHMM